MPSESFNGEIPLLLHGFPLWTFCPLLSFILHIRNISREMSQHLRSIHILFIYILPMLFDCIFYAARKWKRCLDNEKWWNVNLENCSENPLSSHSDIQYAQVHIWGTAIFFFCWILLVERERKKGHRRRSIKTPFLRALTPVQTTSFIPCLEDRHFNWVLLLWLCRSTKWETEWQGAGQEDFGLCGKACVDDVSCPISPANAPLYPHHTESFPDLKPKIGRSNV